MGNHNLSPIHEEQDRVHCQLNGFSYNEFLQECLDVNKDYDKFDNVMNKFLSFGRSNRDTARSNIFVPLFSFAIPAPETIRLLYTAWGKHLVDYPDANFVDLGCGTGVFLWLLNRAGVAKERLIGLELTQEKCRRFAAQYWDNIIRDGTYQIQPNDFVLVAWGESVSKEITSYFANGGKCLAILGEHKGDATYPCDAFVKDVVASSNGILTDVNIKVEFHDVEPSFYTVRMDGLSFNRPV